MFIVTEYAALKIARLFLLVSRGHLQNKINLLIIKTRSSQGRFSPGHIHF